MSDIAGQGDPATPPHRGAGPAWIAVIAVTILAILVAAVLWVRHEPFERAFAALERAQPGDLDVMLHHGLRGDGTALAAAARLRREPGAAAAWVARASGDEESAE